jgi:acyl-CoA synthetase (NDP forming)
MGGAAVITADAADEAGVELPYPSESTLQVLREVLPGFATFSNPADVTAASAQSGNAYETVYFAFARDPVYDTIVFPLAIAGTAEDRNALACKVAEEVPETTICVYWVSQWLEGPGTDALVDGTHVSLFRSLRRCFQAIVKWREWNRRLLQALPPEDPELVEGSRDRSAEEQSGGVLSEAKSRDYLSAAGIEPTAGALVTNVDDALRVALEIGYPVVLKAISPEVPHKTEAGAVAVGIEGAAGVRREYESVVSNLIRFEPGAHVEGVLVTKMVTGGLEMLVGARRDPVYGPVVVCCLGGVAVEVMGRPVIDLAPVDRDLALEMVNRLPGSALLNGYRGSQPLDVSALTNLIVEVSNLITADERVLEIDLNPVVVHPVGCGASILDAMVVLSS